LTRAVERERERLQLQRSRIADRLSHLDLEAEALRTKLQEVDERVELLDRVLASEGAASSLGARILRGATLRQQALEILVTEIGCEQAVSYRDWYDMLLKAGYVVSGKRPLATFLSSVSRSPLVVSGPEVGTYAIDLSAADSLRQELSELQAELRDLDQHLSNRRRGPTPLRQHRVNLLASIRRVERNIQEADQVFEAHRRRILTQPTQAA
jgi:predicted nuclease with TOPRIM domain